MTQPHTLAATIARAIFERIERDRTLILQNIEEVVRDQLAIEGAKCCGDLTIPESAKLHWGDLKNWWQDELDDYEARRYAPPTLSHSDIEYLSKEFKDHGIT